VEKTTISRRVSHFTAASLIALLLIGLVQPACVRDVWVEVYPLHPGDLTPSQLQAWRVESSRIDEALEGINDQHEYIRREYECDSFSDYTAGELARKCFTVKRAMTYTFEYPDGRRGLHHWLFIVVEVGGRELWVPVECTPPNGERQKQYECDCCDEPGGACPGLRIIQYPRIADEAYHALATGGLKPGQRFDGRYFGSIIVWDVATVPECSDSPSPDREPPVHPPHPADGLVILTH